MLSIVNDILTWILDTVRNVDPVVSACCWRRRSSWG
jgi:hypothetical protein